MAPPSWNFTSCNPAAVRMFNVKDEAELASLGPWKLFPEKQPDGRPSAETAKEIIEAVVREGSRVFEWTHKRLGGEDFPSTVSLTRMELAGQTVLQVRVRDISEWTSTRDREAVLAPTIGGRQSASGGFALPRIAGGQVQKNHRGGGETHGFRLLPHLDRATLPTSARPDAFMPTRQRGLAHVVIVKSASIPYPVRDVTPMSMEITSECPSGLTRSAA